MVKVTPKVREGGGWGEREMSHKKGVGDLRREASYLLGEESVTFRGRVCRAPIPSPQSFAFPKDYPRG